MVAASARCAIGFSLSPGQAGDAPEGRALLHSLQGAPQLPLSCHLLMDCAYEGNETRQLALDSASFPWCRRIRVASNPGGSKGLISTAQRDRATFRRLKGFRRIFSRFDKLDLVFIAFIYFALIVEALRE